MGENEPDSSEPRIKIRIESLSDLIFGLALSIGSLTLIGKGIPSGGYDLFVNILLFAFSFLIIVMTWLGYSRTISLLRIETQSALFLNLVLLFCVAIEPYLFYVLVSSQSVSLAYYSSMAYGVDVGGLFIILASLAHLLLKEERIRATNDQRRIHHVILARFKRAMNAQYIIGGIFIVSSLPIFWIPTPIGYLRFVLWYSSFGFLLVFRPRRRKT
jgi:uncharacterized membrane protein